MYRQKYTHTDIKIDKLFGRNININSSQEINKYWKDRNQLSRDNKLNDQTF